MEKMLHFAVLGHPIGHSRSPAIHNAAMRHMGIEGDYGARRAGPEELRRAVDEIRSGSLDGINVTMPLKEEAFRLSEVLSPEAAKSGSVNTMRPGAGTVEGHSTDVVAARAAVADDRFEPVAPILVLGSGGAAAAALVGVAGRSVYVSARHLDRAAAMTDRVGVGAGMVRFGTGVAGALVINATPLGMNGESLPGEVLAVASGVIDFVYGEAPTPTVSAAEARGLPVMDGIEFLVLQAAGSFEWWTGLPAPFEVMSQAARKH
jgi:shikimate dehydrogenase